MSKYFLELRQKFIIKTLSEKGYINRKDLMSHFDISQAVATRDIKVWREANPELIRYNVTKKRYERIG